MTRGQIISFYSFKGGVGRTMALANIACLLAKRPPSNTNGGTPRKRVLMIDWDLESPGLHYYFYKEGLPKHEKGLIQLILDLDLLNSLKQDTPEEQHQRLETLLKDDPWQRYCHRVPGLAEDLDLWFMPHSGFSAGEYHKDLLRLDWRRMEDLAPWALPLVLERISRHFDFVLIDSRTGMADTGLICGYLPDKMVYVFNFNRQSLHGSRPYFQKLLPLRKYNARHGHGSELSVFPLPSMIQEGIPRDFEDWIENPVFGAKRYLSEIFPTGDEESEHFWKLYLEQYYIPYLPQLAYGDQVLSKNPALIGEHSLVKRYYEFSEYLVGSDMAWGQPIPPQPGSAFADLTARATPRVFNLAEAARYLGWMASSGDTYERIGPKNAGAIRSFTDALTFDTLGHSLLNISRHYVETAEAAQDATDRWASIWHDYAKEMLHTTEEGLSLLKKRELPDGFSSMDQGFWSTELWSRAGKSVWTTNVAGVGQSFGRRLDLRAIATQGETVSRGVPVTRIFVLEDNEPPDTRKTLRRILEAQISAGITVCVIERARFDEIKGSAEDEFGSEDFMIVDDLFIYVTERKRSEAQPRASAPKKIRILNSGAKLRIANTLRRQIQAAAIEVKSTDQIPTLVPLSND